MTYEQCEIYTIGDLMTFKTYKVHMDHPYSLLEFAKEAVAKEKTRKVDLSIFVNGFFDHSFRYPETGYSDSIENYEYKNKNVVSAKVQVESDVIEYFILL